jgi:hypothetical protein
MRAPPLLALAGCLAACMVPAASARSAREAWKPSKAKKACRSARPSCRAWRLARSRTFPGSWIQQPEDGPAPGQVPEGEVLGRSVQVRADEYSLTLSRSVVAAGLVTVEFNTVQAEDPHDLQLRSSLGGVQALFGETAPELVPPPRQAFEIPAGSYVLFCTLPGHEGLGMSANLSVR